MLHFIGTIFTPCVLLRGSRLDPSGRLNNSDIQLAKVHDKLDNYNWPSGIIN